MKTQLLQLQARLTRQLDAIAVLLETLQTDAPVENHNAKPFKKRPPSVPSIRSAQPAPRAGTHIETAALAAIEKLPAHFTTDELRQAMPAEFRTGKRIQNCLSRLKAKGRITQAGFMRYAKSTTKEDGYLKFRAGLNIPKPPEILSGLDRAQS